MNLPPLPELPEPPVNDARCFYDPQHSIRYTEHQLREFALAYGRAVQEECAKVAGLHYVDGDSERGQVAQEIEWAIRSTE